MVSWKHLLPIGVSILMFVLIIGMLMYVNQKISDAVNNTNVTIVIGYGSAFAQNVGAQLGTIGTIVGIMLLFGIVVATIFRGFGKGGL